MADSVEEITEKAEKLYLDEAGNKISKTQWNKIQKKLDKQAKQAAAGVSKAANAESKDTLPEDYSKENYGTLDIIQSQTREGLVRSKIHCLDASRVGETIRVRARVHTTRAAAAKICFLVLRQQDYTLQAIVSKNDKISTQMIKFVQGISCDSIVEVAGVLTAPPNPIVSATVTDAELAITHCWIVSHAEPLPFTISDASRPWTEQTTKEKDTLEQQPIVTLPTRLDHRIIDLRTMTNHAIFRISAGIQRFFREFLDNKGFMEIHTPKLMGAASEGGANVFEVSYFKTAKAFLAQSPQLHKQMMITADFERVYEIGPVFRAEDANTYRHMTEFVGLDLEMAFHEHYHEVLDLLDELFLFIFGNLKTKFEREIALIHEQFGGEEFLVGEKPLRMTFSEAVALLRENGVEHEELADMDTTTEKILGKLVREKYKTDFFVVDKFPLAIRPFYTMPDPNLPDYSNSYDFFMRGNEIMSGAQRIHDSEMLIKSAEARNVGIEGIKAYVDAFKYGVLPHAGGGIGLERVVMLYLNIPNIRLASLFPRDPKRLSP